MLKGNDATSENLNHDVNREEKHDGVIEEYNRIVLGNRSNNIGAIICN